MITKSICFQERHRTADGVEIGWQASNDFQKRIKAQEKIREILEDIFNLSYGNKFLRPTQILLYNPADADFFANDVYALYVRTQEERGWTGLMSNSHCWDRIHIGY